MIYNSKGRDWLQQIYLKRGAHDFILANTIGASLLPKCVVLGFVPPEPQVVDKYLQAQTLFRFHDMNLSLVLSLSVSHFLRLSVSVSLSLSLCLHIHYEYILTFVFMIT